MPVPSNSNSNNQPLYLGVDGGGTHCRARLVGEDGKVLAEGLSGAANTLRGLEASKQQILIATRQALAKAGLADADMSRLHVGIGLAGLSLSQHQEAMNALDHPFATMVSRCDAHIACLGAHSGGDGGVAIFGTGSCAYGKKANRFIRVGGWGFRLSDHGSGAQAGYQAVRLALLALESGRPCSGFVKAVLSQFDRDPQQMVVWGETATPADFGGFARTLAEWSQQGDSDACAVMEKTAEEAALILQFMIDQGVSRISLVGGFANPLRPWLPEHLQEYLVPPQGDSLDGALLLARQHIQD